MITNLNNGKRDERFLLIKLEQYKLAIPLLSAKEVLAPKPLTTLPDSHPNIKGIFNLRDEVVTIIDLKIKLGLKNKSNTSLSESFVILNDDSISYGIIVDDVEKVINITDEQIESVEAFPDMIKNKSINRVAKINEEIILIIDSEQLKTDFHTHKLAA